MSQGESQVNGEPDEFDGQAQPKALPRHQPPLPPHRTAKDNTRVSQIHGREECLSSLSQRTHTHSVGTHVVIVILDGLPREVEHGPGDDPLTDEMADLKVCSEDSL